MSGTLRLNDTTFATETNGNITTNVSELKINDQTVIDSNKSLNVSDVKVGGNTVIDSNKSLNVSDVKVGGNTVIDSNRKMTGVDIVPTTNFTFRNKIINGNFDIWQRGNTSRTFGFAGVYSADRWCRMGHQSAAHERVTVSSPVAGMTSRYAIRSSSCTTAEEAIGSRMHVDQKIENVNCYDLAGKQITLSFWIRFSSTASSLGSPFYSRVQYNTSNTDSPTSSDVGDGYICFTDILSTSLPTAWTKITKTGLVPANVQNLSARFSFAYLVSTTSAGSEWFEITGVQLEEGTVPTPFEHRPIGTELSLCQRYYEKSFNLSTTPANNTGERGVVYTHQQSGYGTAVPITFKERKRAAGGATIIYNPYNTTANRAAWLASTNQAFTHSSVYDITETGFFVINYSNPLATPDTSGNMIAFNWSVESEL